MLDNVEVLLSLAWPTQLHWRTLHYGINQGNALGNGAAAELGSLCLREVEVLSVLLMLLLIGPPTTAHPPGAQADCPATDRVTATVSLKVVGPHN